MLGQFRSVEIQARAVTISLVTPARCQSVSLPTQNRRTRSRTVSALMSGVEPLTITRCPWPRWANDYFRQTPRSRVLRDNGTGDRQDPGPPRGITKGTGVACGALES